MTQTLTVPQGAFDLVRLPLRRHEPLQAWDAADEYLLTTLAERGLPTTTRILVINDSFGALAVALAAFHPTAWSDSYISQQATRLNLQANNLMPDSVIFLDSLQIPTGEWDVVLIKAPKSLAYFEDVLLRLRPQLTPATQVMVAGMLKHLPASVWSLLERTLGSTTTSLAKKKARLIFATLNPMLKVSPNPYPSSYGLENTPYRIINHANVFSREQLDIGTRFFLQHLPTEPQAQTIVDLGCGNGVLGLMAATLHPKATLIFVDESFMAVASARQNFTAAFGEQRAAEFTVSNGLEDFAPDSVDLVLCNPPFHQQQTVGDQMAFSLFRQARKALKPGGALWIVGNRHLGHQMSLQKLFGNAKVMAVNAKFVVLKALRLHDF